MSLFLDPLCVDLVDHLVKVTPALKATIPQILTVVGLINLPEHLWRWLVTAPRLRATIKPQLLSCFKARESAVALRLLEKHSKGRLDQDMLEGLLEPDWRWTLVFQQTSPLHMPKDNWRSFGSPGDDNYSNLDGLEGFRGTDGKLTLKLVLTNEECVRHNIWRQHTNPVTATREGLRERGYEPLDIQFADTEWRGLDCSTWNLGPDGIPGMLGVDAALCADKVELYVLASLASGVQAFVCPQRPSLQQKDMEYAQRFFFCGLWWQISDFRYG